MITESYTGWFRCSRHTYCRYDPRDKGLIRVGVALRALFQELYPDRELAVQQYSSPFEALLKKTLIEEVSRPMGPIKP